MTIFEWAQENELPEACTIVLEKQDYNIPVDPFCGNCSCHFLQSDGPMEDAFQHTTLWHSRVYPNEERFEAHRQTCTDAFISLTGKRCAAFYNTLSTRKGVRAAP